MIALSGRYEQILNYVIAMDFLFFGLTATTIFVFRRRAARGEMNASDGYRMPGHPVSTAMFVAICWWVVGEYDLPLSAEQPDRFRSAAGGYSRVLVLEPANTVAIC